MAGFSIEIIEPQQDKQQPIELQKLGPLAVLPPPSRAST